MSEVIAQLWNAVMPTRMAYPGRVDRIPMIVGQGPQELEGTQFPLELLPQVPDDDPTEPTWYVLLGTLDERLMWWRPEVETTSTPVERLWGPGNWRELKAAVDDFSTGWRSDVALVLDRLFYVQVQDGAVDAARSATQVLDLHDRVEGETWFVMIADTPGDARIHVHRVLSGSCTKRECDCPATTILRHASRDAAARHATKQLAA